MNLHSVHMCSMTTLVYVLRCLSASNMFLQVFTVDNVLMIALLAEFVSCTQSYVHAFDNLGGSAGSGKAVKKGPVVRRIMQSAVRARDTRRQLARLFDYKDPMTGRSHMPLVLDPTFKTGYVQLVTKVLGTLAWHCTVVCVCACVNFSSIGYVNCFQMIIPQHHAIVKCVYFVNCYPQITHDIICCDLV